MKPFINSFSLDQLRELADLFSIQTAYTDAAGIRREASSAALLTAIQLRSGISPGEDTVDRFVERLRASRIQPLIEPVTVIWLDESQTAEIVLPALPLASPSITYDLRLENGEVWTGTLGPQVSRSTPPESNLEKASRLSVSLPARVPVGYHRLELTIDGRSHQTMILAAPRRAYSPETTADTRQWGVFAPVYACHSENSWGGGDLSDMQRLASWVEGLGGSVVATLPLLPAFLDTPFDPSPYSPVSRLFWNEFYVAMPEVMKMTGSGTASAITNSESFKRDLALLREKPQVDYRKQMALKRRVLELVAEEFFSSDSETERWAAFEKFVDSRPAAAEYAWFRATLEQKRKPWREWGEDTRPEHSGPFTSSELKNLSPALRYHLFVQWLMDEQMNQLAETARETGSGLYLDFPLGVHPDGYDAWREQSLFVKGAAVGAPPDPFFTRGQNWGFSPIDPDRLRESGYAYFIECLRHHLSKAGVLRLDHVMALHRLFWIPAGMEATDGVYITYPFDELYAILSIESHRSRSIILGEDLGTVPDEVRRGMADHGIRRLYVVQYELNPNRKPPLNDVDPLMVASMNTHDMPPFAAFWQGDDIDDRERTGLLDATQAEQERGSRATIKNSLTEFLGCHSSFDGGESEAVLDAALQHLAASDAEIVLINLEDLWGESGAQNTPGTGPEGENWTRKFGPRFEEITSNPRLTSRLRRIDQLRKIG